MEEYVQLHGGRLANREGKMFKTVSIYCKEAMRKRPLRVTLAEDEQEWPAEILGTIWNGRKVRVVSDYTVRTYRMEPLDLSIFNPGQEIDLSNNIETVYLKKWGFSKIIPIDSPWYVALHDPLEKLCGEIERRDPQEIFYRNRSARAWTELMLTPKWTRTLKLRFRFDCLLQRRIKWHMFPGLWQQRVRASLWIGFLEGKNCLDAT